MLLALKWNNQISFCFNNLSLTDNWAEIVLFNAPALYFTAIYLIALCTLLQYNNSRTLAPPCTAIPSFQITVPHHNVLQTTTVHDTATIHRVLLIIFPIYLEIIIVGMERENWIRMGNTKNKYNCKMERIVWFLLYIIEWHNVPFPSYNTDPVV